MWSRYVSLEDAREDLDSDPDSVLDLIRSEKTDRTQSSNGRIANGNSENPQISPNNSGNGRHRSHSASWPAYEEFMEGSIPCPSCHGTGKIPQDKEDQLVALIPMSDSRLKPRRTTLYVIIAILICLLIGGLLAYFLFPRGIQLLSNSPNLKPVALYVNTSQEIVRMTLVNEYNITNNNFYSVDIQNLSVVLTFDLKLIAKTINTTAVSVPLRSTMPYNIMVNVTFEGDEGYIAHYCGDESHRSHNLLLPFEANLKTTYFGGLLENTLTTYQHVRCTKQVVY